MRSQRQLSKCFNAGNTPKITGHNDFVISLHEPTLDSLTCSHATENMALAMLTR